MNAMRRCMLLWPLVALAACALERPAVRVRSYLLTPPDPAAAHDAAARALYVAPFDVAPQFEGKPLVYRFDEVRYEADFYNEFLVAPRMMFKERSEAWLQRAGYAVAAHATPHAAILRGSVSALYGDFRDPQRPRAILALRFVLMPPGKDDVAAMIERSYDYAIPLTDRRAATLVEGLSIAFGRALMAFDDDLRSPGRATLSAPRPSSAVRADVRPESHR